MPFELMQIPANGQGRAQEDLNRRVRGGLSRMIQFLVICVCFHAEICRAVVVADAGLERSPALAAESAYAAVGWVAIKEGTSNYRGTGVLISSEWVLTAAPNWLANAVTGLEFHIGGETYTAIPGDWAQHPYWVASPEVSHTQGSDIALFHLSRPVTVEKKSGLSPQAVMPC